MKHDAPRLPRQSSHDTRDARAAEILREIALLQMLERAQDREDAERWAPRLVLLAQVTWGLCVGSLAGAGALYLMGALP